MKQEKHEASKGNQTLPGDPLLCSHTSGEKPQQLPSWAQYQNLQEYFSYLQSVFPKFFCVSLPVISEQGLPPALLSKLPLLPCSPAELLCHFNDPPQSAAAELRHFVGFW